MLLPAMKPVIDPPSLFAAVTAHSEPPFSFPSRCSKMASVDRRRERKEGEKRGRVVVDVRMARTAVCRAVGSIIISSFCDVLTSTRSLINSYTAFVQ